MANRKETNAKHDVIVDILGKGIHSKYNKNADSVIFVELGQYDDRKVLHPSAWIRDQDKKMVILGNEKVLYIFHSDNLAKIVRDKNDRVKDYPQNNNRGLVLFADEADKLCDMKVEL